MYPHPPFSQDQFMTCYRAYASALLAIQNEKGTSNQSPPNDATCLAVALRIIEASARGERDPSGLKQRGLHGFDEAPEN